MKIAFLCSSLAPGRDGVGDYSRRLAAECIRQGHPSVILGLNDAYVDESVVEAQKMDGASISVLRLPGTIDKNIRAMLARKWLGNFGPDWMSLQYVCYGYHPKGVPLRWNPIFARLTDICVHRHLGWHELWISPPPPQRRLIRLVQKWIIRDLHQRFRAQVITTSLPLYQRRLAREGIMAKVLPLFGNIPIAVRDDERVAGLLRAAGSRMIQKPRASFLNGVFFGTIHPDFNPTPLIHWLGELRSRADKTILLSMIGHGGAAAGLLAKKLVSLMPDAIEMVSLGEQPEEIISQVLLFADFGINTGSSQTLGKSGTFAAMQEHGLPILVADGELDSGVQVNGVPPVRQFSTKDSLTIAMNGSCLASAQAGVVHTATTLIDLFARSTVGVGQNAAAT